MLRLQAYIFIFSVVSSGAYAAATAPVCGANSELKPCGSLCESTCFEPEERSCTPENKESCEQECRCLSGFVRNPETKECINVTDCPSCGQNEEIGVCARTCEMNCRTPTLISDCVASCPKGCKCKQGFLRNDATDLCVSWEECPPPPVTAVTPIE